jgi:hypothetical protein
LALLDPLADQAVERFDRVAVVAGDVGGELLPPGGLEKRVSLHRRETNQRTQRAR